MYYESFSGTIHTWVTWTSRFHTLPTSTLLSIRSTVVWSCRLLCPRWRRDGSFRRDPSRGRLPFTTPHSPHHPFFPLDTSLTSSYLWISYHPWDGFRTVFLQYETRVLAFSVTGFKCSSCWKPRKSRTKQEAGKVHNIINIIEGVRSRPWDT